MNALLRLLLVLMLAGYVGAVGGQLVLPFVEGLGFHAAGVPAALFLMIMVWAPPLAGQLGVHPLLAASLLFPLLPTPTELGVSAPALANAALAGWCLSSASTPFTATVVLIGSYAGATANEVARKWNGLYALACGAILSVWVLLYSAMF